MSAKGVPRTTKGVPRGTCTVCGHPERARIDYLLICTAGEVNGGRRSLADQFGLSPAALYRHRQNHIPQSYIAAVKVALQAEERLRNLAVANSTSVLQRFNGLYNGHLVRWLRALEGGHDSAMCQHGNVLGTLLVKIGQLTHELLPSGSNVQNNVFLSPDFASFQQRAVTVLRRHPEALRDWLEEFSPAPGPRLIEAAADD